MSAGFKVHLRSVTLALALLLVSAGCGRDDPSGPSKPAQAAAKAPLPPRSNPAVSVVETFRRATEAGDTPSAVATFADDIVLHSPALLGSGYQGRDVAGAIVGSAFRVLADVRVTDLFETNDGGPAGLLLDARVGNEPAQGFVLLRIQAGMVSELTFLLRPLPALRSFVARMAQLGAQPALDLKRQQDEPVN